MVLTFFAPNACGSYRDFQRWFSLEPTRGWRWGLQAADGLCVGCSRTSRDKMGLWCGEIDAHLLLSKQLCVASKWRAQSYWNVLWMHGILWAYIYIYIYINIYINIYVVILKCRAPPTINIYINIINAAFSLRISIGSSPRHYPEIDNLGWTLLICGLLTSCI